MPGKKKGKKKGSKGKKKSGDGEENKEEKLEPVVILPTYGWIKLTVSANCHFHCLTLIF